jgi:hypothetical protein
MEATDAQRWAEGFSVADGTVAPNHARGLGTNLA